MLAVAYVIQLEDLRREVDVLNLATGIASALGGTGRHLEWESVKAEFDIGLGSPVGAGRERPNTSRAIKVRALGMG